MGLRRQEETALTLTRQCHNQVNYSQKCDRDHFLTLAPYRSFLDVNHCSRRRRIRICLRSRDEVRTSGSFTVITGF